MKAIINGVTEEITTGNVIKVGNRLRITRASGEKRWATVEQITNGVPTLKLITSAAPAFVQTFSRKIGRRRLYSPFDDPPEYHESIARASRSWMSRAL